MSMSATENLSTPAEIDTKLAELYEASQKISNGIAAAHTSLLHDAGAKFYYRGRNRVTDMEVSEAREIVTARIAQATTEDYRITFARELLAKLDALVLDLIDNRNAIIDLDNLYTGWSRFFVVTSSNGHIHSSMHCSTCRPTTTYGWLPHLSGKNQAEAIENFGSAAECLCSVCFPDAPVARKDGNLTAKQRDALLAGKTPETTAAKPVCEGSGQYAEVARQGYAAGNWAECPVCKAHVGGGRKVRKHAPKVVS